MKIGELAIGIVFLTVAVAAFVMASGMHSISNPADSGPGAYPMLMSGFMGICALGVIFNALRGIRKRKGFQAGEWQLALLTFAVGLAYVTLFQPMGYVLSTIAVLVILMLVGGVRKWKPLVAVPVIYVAVTFWLFNNLLMLELPPLPFLQ